MNINEATATVTCHETFGRLLARCIGGYVPTLQTERHPSLAKMSAVTFGRLTAARMVADRLEAAGLKVHHRAIGF